MVEFPDPKNAVHEAARQLDLTILKWLERFCEDAALPDAQQAARQILHIAKGCFLMAPAVGIEASEAITLNLLSHVLAQAEEVRPLPPMKVKVTVQVTLTLPPALVHFNSTSLFNTSFPCPNHPPNPPSTKAT